MKKKGLVERGLGVADQVFSPMVEIKEAHKNVRAKGNDDVGSAAPFPPADVNAYDEFIGQVHNAHPEIEPYIDTLYDMVQTPADIERGLGMLALILDNNPQ